MSLKATDSELQLIYLKDLIIFPNMVVSLSLTNPVVIKALQVALDRGNKVLFTALKDSTVELPKKEDLFKVGCVAEVLQIITQPAEKDSLQILVKALDRVNLQIKKDKQGHFYAAYTPFIDNKHYSIEEVNDLKNEIINNLVLYLNNRKTVPPQLLTSVKKLEDINAVIGGIVSHLPIQHSEKQNILENPDLVSRVAILNSLLEAEAKLVNVEKKIRESVKKQMEKNQKDYYLNEQVKAIQQELNNGNDIKDEIKEFKKKLEKIKISTEGKEKLENEIKKLSMMNPISAEATVVRNYIEWIFALPWNVFLNNKIDLKKAEEYLEEDHYALTKVKERILEYLAVLKKSSSLKAPILCLVGPPGVGKTSLAKSIAKASGREFIRISLGGVRDEAEIRGHRRTYIGAMPGKIIQSMRKVKASNPLILLDEIDKMGSDFRGDPASALLEVLDKEQNHNFVDHYIELEYNLSNVMFIATANSLDIQDALLDRMEVIHLTGYSEEEKLAIAEKHLLPKKMVEAALNSKEFNIDNNAILEVIRNYTKESGVRELDRVLARVARRVAKDIVSNKVKKVNVTPKNLVTYADSAPFLFNAMEQEDLIGVTAGLAWTRVGGDTLYIEAVKFPGKGEIKITGKLGEVMQESVKAAYSLLRANCETVGLKPEDFTNYDVHIHVPEGATPKDGPSAGVTILTSIYSILSSKKVKKDIAMTGEITLRGKVLIIGGLREKLLAALRAGISTVLIPKDNEKDLIDLPKSALDKLQIIKVNTYLDVLENAILSYTK